MRNIIITLLLLAPMAFVNAQKTASLEVFHGDGCPHCHQFFDWVPQLEKSYPDLNITEHEVWKSPTNQAKFMARMAELNSKSSGVPTIIIEDEIVVGFNKSRIIALMEKHFGPGATTITADNTANNPAQNPVVKLWNFIKNLFSKKS